MEKMRGLLFCLLCALFAVLLAGCRIESYVSRSGVQGFLVDHEDGTPIAKKKISVSVDGKTFSRKTDNKGFFKVAPERGYYMSWVICGPVIIDTQVAEISIVQDGYKGYYAKLVTEYVSRNPDFSNYEVGEPGIEFFFLGDILLEKVD